MADDNEKFFDKFFAEVEPIRNSLIESLRGIRPDMRNTKLCFQLEYLVDYSCSEDEADWPLEAFDNPTLRATAKIRAVDFEDPWNTYLCSEQFASDSAVIELGDRILYASWRRRVECTPEIRRTINLASTKETHSFKTEIVVSFPDFDAPDRLKDLEITFKDHLVTVRDSDKLPVGIASELFS